MIIELDSRLKKIEPRPEYREQAEKWTRERRADTRKHFPAKIQRKLGDGHSFLHSSIGEPEDLQLGFLQTLSEAYSHHEKVEIAPHDVWFMVLNELGQLIKANVEGCRPIFTNSSDSVSISVPVSDPTHLDVPAVIRELNRLMPMPVDTFVPSFSSTPADAQLAMYAALCDGVSPYYDYSTYCCGIPAIRLMGSESEWGELVNRVDTVRSLFDSVGYKKATTYLTKVSKVIWNISRTFDRVDVDFWKNIFTSQNMGSGGEVRITGWITDLFATQPEDRKLDNYLTTLAIIPYTNLTTNQDFKGVYGAFERQRTQDDFLRTGYASLVYEIVPVVPKEKKADDGTIDLTLVSEPIATRRR